MKTNTGGHSVTSQKGEHSVTSQKGGHNEIDPNEGNISTFFLIFLVGAFCNKKYLTLT